jgi:hypothetical protein
MMQNLKKSIFIVFGGLLAIALTCNLYAGEPAVIVTVDGLSFTNTLMPWNTPIDDTGHYLKTALDTMNLDLTDTTITAFTWSRNANDTLETVEDLCIFLKEKYKEAQTANKRFIIVAHSWGTVLTYLALSSQSRQVPENERLYVDLYITLGSPLGTDSAHDGSNYPEETTVINYTAFWLNKYNFCDTCQPLVEKWVNYWAWGDVISGPLDGFMPFTDYPLWEDNQVDRASFTAGYPGRNVYTTGLWHKYDSLQPGGLMDNQPLLDQVKSQLEDNVTPSNDEPPFGSFDTPLDGSTVRSSVPVTGWALDDLTINSVKIYRAPLSGEGNDLIYIGDTNFVEGARPDIQVAYPGYPNRDRAGWGYLMLTNFLPNEGNGTFTFHAIATDSAGHQVTLGIKTIIVDNANAVKPFGAIDAPTQGGTTSGYSFINWGWILTPLPNNIPTDGSTINVIVDGVNLGHPIYNNYRSDIAKLFPGYANSNGAVGYFYLDTTVYENGVHTIQWTATDSGGNTDGIGSRYFIIENTGGSSQRSLVNGHWSLDKEELSSIPVDHYKPIRIKKGCNEHRQPQEVYPDEEGVINLRIKELERVEVHLEERPVVKNHFTLKNYTGYMVAGDQLRPLPIGSTLDAARGIFYWSPGVGFVGNYQLVFVDKLRNQLRRINIQILPIYSH